MTDWFTEEQVEKAAQANYNAEIRLWGAQDIANCWADAGDDVQLPYRVHARAALRAVNPFETDAARDVLAERARQIAVEGWTPKHDDEHSSGEMAMAAACYAAPRKIRAQFTVPCGCRSVGECTHMTFPKLKWTWAWPWSSEWWKPRTPRENLVRAGALILAEIERLDRLSPSTQEGK
jgi:hypothetical protein